MAVVSAPPAPAALAARRPPPGFPPVISPGLERVQKALARLGHPEESFASVLVAGTNGKGSVAAMMESVLRRAGHRTGLFTSPHLRDERERIRVVGRPISQRAWNRLARRAAGRGLTEFEAQTLIAFLHFAEAGVDIAVVEVGLGGRLDATNALPAPEATVITSIGHDHHAWLGPTLRHIHREKRGIARPGTALIQNLPRGFWPDNDRWAASRGIPCWTYGREIRLLSRRDHARRPAIGQNLVAFWPGGRSEEMFIPLVGEHQARNAALALAALDVLKRRGWRLTPRDIKKGFAQVRWPGRFEVLQRRPPVVLDGAHNADAALALARAWSRSPWGKEKAAVVFGCLKDKDAPAMARALAPHARRVITVPLPTPRSRGAEELAHLWSRRAPAETANNFKDAWRKVSRDRGPVLVTGSLYLVGEALEFFGRAA